MERIRITRFYIIGKCTKYYYDLPNAILCYSNMETDKGWKALGVEYVRSDSKYNPCSIDLYIQKDNINKISDDYIAIGLEKQLKPLVEDIKLYVGL